MFGLEYLPKRFYAKDIFSSLGLPVKEVASTPYTLAATAGTLSLRHYSSALSSKKLPVFIIPSFINDNFILDLLPEKSLIQNYLNTGHDVYLMDWGCPEDHEKNLAVETFFEIYLCYFMEVVFSRHQTSQVHLLGHCLGGTLAAIWASLKPEAVKTLTLLTAPIDIQGPHALHNWATFEDFDVELAAKAFDSIPWALMQASFLSLKPLQGLYKIESYFKAFYQNQFSKKDINFWALESWSNENINMRSQFFRFLLQNLYRDNSLAAGNLKIKDTNINLRNISAPCLVVVAQEDHIVCSTSHLGSQHLGSRVPLKVIHSEGGHIGALIGGKAQKNTWPSLTQWLSSHEE